MTLSTEYTEYLQHLNFKEDDVLCLGRINGQGCHNSFTKMSVLLESSTFEQIQGWNEHNNIYISMAPLLPNVSERKKEQVKAVRHLFVEIDDDTQAALTKIQEDVKAWLIPLPSLIIESSPGKAQVIWNVQEEDFLKDGRPDIQKHELYLDTLCERYHGDSNSTDTHRFLRPAGFKNLKYSDKPLVKLLGVGDKTPRPLSDFKIPLLTLEKIVSGTPCNSKNLADSIQEELNGQPIPYRKHEKTGWAGTEPRAVLTGLHRGIRMSAESARTKRHNPKRPSRRSSFYHRLDKADIRKSDVGNTDISLRALRAR